MRWWIQNTWRLIANPYTFFEDRMSRGTSVPAMGVFLFFLLCETLGWRFVGRVDSVWFWTGSFLVPLVTYPGAVFSIYLVCHLLVRENHLSSFFAVWGFSYLPTFLFFSLAIILHMLQRFTFFFFFTRLVDINGFMGFHFSDVLMEAAVFKYHTPSGWKFKFQADRLGNIPFRVYGHYLLVGRIKFGFIQSTQYLITDSVFIRDHSNSCRSPVVV